MSLPSNSRSVLFLRSLKQKTQPLDKLLQDSFSETKHLFGWLGNPQFVKQYKEVMRRRQQIHELSGHLTSFWASEQFSAKLQEINVTLEMLRKAAQPMKKSAEDPAPAEPPSFIHPGLDDQEKSALIEVLHASDKPSDSASAGKRACRATKRRRNHGRFC